MSRTLPSSSIVEKTPNPILNIDAHIAKNSAKDDDMGPTPPDSIKTIIIIFVIIQRLRSYTP